MESKEEKKSTNDKCMECGIFDVKLWINSHTFAELYCGLCALKKRGMDLNVVIIRECDGTYYRNGTGRTNQIGPFIPAIRNSSTGKFYVPAIRITSVGLFWDYSSTFTSGDLNAIERWCKLSIKK